MLGKLWEVVQYDTVRMGELPFWAELVYLAIWFVPIGVCLYQDHHALYSRWGESRNTIHTAFWLVVILTLPIAGSLFYLIGSLIPSMLWESRVGKREFAWTFRLRKGQLLSLLCALLLPLAVHAAVRLIPGIDRHMDTSIVTRHNWCFELSFLCWSAVILSDWLMSVHHCAVYLRLASQEKPAVQEREVLGIPYIREGIWTKPSALLREEAKQVRGLADIVFRQHVYGPDLLGKKVKIMEDGRERFCQVVGTKQEWLEEKPDMIEMREIGRGITRCRVGIWKERAGKFSCKESILYRAVPKLTGWLCRACILLIVQAAAGAPQAAELHMHILDSLTFWGL